MSRGDEARAVPIIQADRDAAADLVSPSGRWPGFPADFRSGRADQNELTQAFAKHRLTFAASQSIGEMPGREARYLIRKGGVYYRPNAEGYTPNKAEAGRYTLAEAIRHSHPNGPDGPRDGIDYILSPEAALLPPAPSATGEAGNE